MVMVAAGPARLTTRGPSTANPTANAAWSVNVNSPLATSSCSWGATRAIMAASAGMKNVVAVAAMMTIRYIKGSWSPKITMSAKATARTRFVASRIVRRRSNRSTNTPAGADSSTAGARKARKRRLTAVESVTAQREGDERQRVERHVGSQLRADLREPQRHEPLVAHDRGEADVRLTPPRRRPVWSPRDPWPPRRSAWMSTTRA